MKAKHQKIKSIFLILILFLITTSPILLSALQKNFAIRVACVGDSITYGAKIEDNFLNSYPAQLQLFLGSDYLVGNFGASGYTLQKSGNFPYWNHPAFQESSAFQPNIVLIMLGTNDTKPYNWTGTENFLADYRELIAHYRSLKSQPQIYLMTPATILPESFKPANGYKMQADVADLVSNAVKELGEEEHLPVIDVHAYTRTHPEYFLLDGVHPDAYGAKAIARLTFEALRENESSFQK